MTTTNNTPKTVETKKVKIYETEDKYIFTECNDAERCVFGEISVNGDYWEYAKIVEDCEDGRVSLYNEQTNYVREITKNDFVSYKCYVIENNLESDKTDGCQSCKFYKECKSEYEIKDVNEDVKIIFDECDYDIGKIYFDGSNQQCARLDGEEELSLEKIEEAETIEEINTRNKDIRKEGYDYWREKDNGNIWLRRLPSGYTNDYFVEWESLNSTKIEDLEEWIKDYNNPYGN